MKYHELAKERRFAELLFAAGLAESRFTDAIIEAAGDEDAQDAWEYERITGDDYDESIEFRGVGNDVRLNDLQQRLIFEAGFNRCWLNHKDGTETFYMLGSVDSGVKFEAKAGHHHLPHYKQPTPRKGRRMSRYIYHFHAFWQVEPGSLAHNDGIIMRDTPIDTGDRYSAVRDALAEKYGVSAARLTIGALSYLGRETCSAEPGGGGQ